MSNFRIGEIWRPVAALVSFARNCLSYLLCTLGQVQHRTKRDCFLIQSTSHCLHMCNREHRLYFHPTQHTSDGRHAFIHPPNSSTLHFLATSLRTLNIAIRRPISPLETIDTQEITRTLIRRNIDGTGSTCFTSHIPQILPYLYRTLQRYRGPGV